MAEVEPEVKDAAEELRLRMGRYYRSSMLRWGVLLALLAAALAAVALLMWANGPAVRDGMIDSTRANLGPYFDLIPNGHASYSRYLDAAVGNHLCFFIVTAGYAITCLALFILYYGALLVLLSKVVTASIRGGSYFGNKDFREHQRHRRSAFRTVGAAVAAPALAAVCIPILITLLQGYSLERLTGFAQNHYFAATVSIVSIFAMTGGVSTYRFFRGRAGSRDGIRRALAFKATATAFGLLSLWVLMALMIPTAVDAYNRTVYEIFDASETELYDHLLERYYDGRIITGLDRATLDRMRDRVIAPLDLIDYRDVSAGIKAFAEALGTLWFDILVAFFVLDAAAPTLALKIANTEDLIS